MSMSMPPAMRQRADDNGDSGSIGRTHRYNNPYISYVPPYPYPHLQRCPPTQMHMQIPMQQIQRRESAVQYIPMPNMMQQLPGMMAPPNDPPPPPMGLPPLSYGGPPAAPQFSYNPDLYRPKIEEQIADIPMATLKRIVIETAAVDLYGPLAWALEIV